MNESATVVVLEPASPAVKRYQMLKLLAGIAGATAGFAWLGIFAVLFGPALGDWLKVNLPDQRWLQLWLVAAALVVTLEMVSLPPDFWSGYVVEHEYQLSNQTLRGWIWRRVKGWLVGGVLGWLLLSGLYAVLWATGDWWWLWATGGWLLATIVLGQLLPVPFVQTLSYELIGTTIVGTLALLMLNTLFSDRGRERRLFAVRRRVARRPTGMLKRR